MNLLCDQLKVATTNNQKSYRNREEDFTIILGQTKSLNALIQEIYQVLKESRANPKEKEILALDNKIEVLNRISQRYSKVE